MAVAPQYQDYVNFLRVDSGLNTRFLAGYSRDYKITI